jgi:ribosomal protein S18 acetylase RimI-like enzyme
MKASNTSDETSKYALPASSLGNKIAFKSSKSVTSQTPIPAPTEIQIRQMTRSELDLCLQWAANEGWNPGLHDAEIFWVTDPQGFFVAEQDGQIIGTGSMVYYSPNLFFLGLFIVPPNLRGNGIGREMFSHWQSHMQQRLELADDQSPKIGMDGVLAMQPFYKQGGFRLEHQQTRHSIMTGAWTKLNPNESVCTRDVAELPFEQVLEFDRLHFGVRRSTFLRQWLQPKDGWTRCVVGADGQITALGTIRRATKGWRIGPLFATGREAADLLLRDLCNRVNQLRSDVVYLDVPQANSDAVALVKKYQMSPEFTCGRMYCGPAPTLPWQQIFGVTSLELG